MKNLSVTKVVPLIVVISLITGVLGLSIGYFFLTPSVPVKVADKQEQEAGTKWTCSMHPQVMQDKPGKCPICFMDLIPVKNAVADGTLPELFLTPAAQKLAEIQTMPVVRKFVYSNIRMTGKIEYNESKLAYITARMPGRIDRLFVNYTGIPVKKGDHMAEYYSPELLVAQRELLLAAKNLKNADKNDVEGYGLSPEKLFQTVQKKLELWGLTEQNIKKIVDTGEVSKYVVLYAPIGGIVIEKNALEGKYFKTGDRLFTIADLSLVWVMLDAYESDISELRYGQKVEFTSEAYPGETFSGRISFIEPMLNEKTRTVKVRVDAPNPDGKLKPGMFVRAVVRYSVSADGKVVMDDYLAGKWISPMHPEIIKNGPGKCDICGMDLVKAETLGYETNKREDLAAPLVIPATAPLITGKRAVVYVESKTNPGSFTGREVVLGPRCGNYYIVKQGLQAGELVVVNGNFKIDSALQLLAKPSMMGGEGDEIGNSKLEIGEGDKKPDGGNQRSVPDSFKELLNPVYENYLAIQTALSKDDFKTAMKNAELLKNACNEIKTGSLTEKLQESLSGDRQEIAKIAEESSKSQDITQFRANFANLSASVYLLSKTFGVSEKFKIKKFHCPMAFNNKGADWLQQSDEVENPYFGATMYRCGEKVEDLK